MKRLVWFCWLLLVIGALVSGMRGTAVADTASNDYCIGYLDDDTDCEPVFAGATWPATALRTYVRKWIATTDGVVERVHHRFGADITHAGCKAVVFEGVTMKASVALTPVANSWVWSDALVAKDGQSLSFEEGDELYFGVTVTPDPSIHYAYKTAGTNFYLASVYDDDPLNWSYSAINLATILEYSVGISDVYTETFYMSAAGDASAPETVAGAWDLSDVNTAGNWAAVDSDDGKLGPNDRLIVLDDDGVFRGELEIQQSGLITKPITIVAEEGGTPTFYGSQDYDSVGQWNDLGANLWATANSTFAVDVGFILFGVEAQNSVGTKVEAQVDLNALREFFHDTVNDRVIIYSTANPSGLANGIEIAYSPNDQYDYLLQIYDKDYITIDGLTLKYFNPHGVQVSRCKGITLQNMQVSYGGGQYLAGTTRYGNGIEFWCHTEDVVCDNNTVTQIFDAAISVQISGAGCDDCIRDNIRIRNNTVSYSGAGITYIQSAGGTTADDDILISLNTISNSGQGWSGTDTNEHCSGAELNKTSTGTLTNFLFSRNTIDVCGPYEDPLGGLGIMTQGGAFDIKWNKISNTMNCGIRATEAGGEQYSGDIIGNLIIDTDKDGVWVTNATDEANPGTLNILNNTIYDVAAASIGFDLDANVDKVNFKNNIINTGAAARAIWVSPDATNLDFDYNLYNNTEGELVKWQGTAYTIAEWEDYKTATSQDTNSLTPGVAQFKDAAGGDFSLRWTSPCIDAGVNAGVTEDYAGKATPIRGAFDIGAFEVYREVWFKRLLHRLGLGL